MNLELVKARLSVLQSGKTFQKCSITQSCKQKIAHVTAALNRHNYIKTIFECSGLSSKKTNGKSLSFSPRVCLITDSELQCES